MSAFTAKCEAGELQVFLTCDEIPEAVWQKFYGNDWKDHRFLEIVEETLIGFEYFYLTLCDNSGKVVGLQPGFITKQDLAIGFPSVLRRGVLAIRHIYTSFLNPQMAFLGSPAANGQHTTETPMDFLAESFLAYAKHRKVSFLTFKEFPFQQRASLRNLQRHGYTALASYPGVSMKLDFSDYETYLAKKVGHSTRKSLRRKFRDLEKQPAIRMECVTDISPNLDRIESLYLEVFERSSEKFEKLTKNFFTSVAERLGDRAKFFFWWQNETLIAFSLCWVHDGIFYDDYLGMDYTAAHDLHLYYVTFRDQITWALSQGLRHYYSTPMNFEPKLRLGFELVPLDLYVRHTSPILNRIFGPLAKAFAPTLKDPVLKQFSNYSLLNPS